MIILFNLFWINFGFFKILGLLDFDYFFCFKYFDGRFCLF